MSLTMLLALCILSCDFLLYALFHWLYGEKYKKHTRRVAARRERRRTLPGQQAAQPRALSFSERILHCRTGYF